MDLGSISSRLSQQFSKIGRKEGSAPANQANKPEQVLRAQVSAVQSDDARSRAADRATANDRRVERVMREAQNAAPPPVNPGEVEQVPPAKNAKRALRETVKNLRSIAGLINRIDKLSESGESGETQAQGANEGEAPAAQEATPEKRKKPIAVALSKLMQNYQVREREGSSEADLKELLDLV